MATIDSDQDAEHLSISVALPDHLCAEAFKDYKHCIVAPVMVSTDKQLHKEGLAMQD